MPAERDDAIREDSRGVDEHVLGEVHEGDTVQGVVGVCVYQVWK